MSSCAEKIYFICTTCIPAFVCVSPPSFSHLMTIKDLYRCKILLSGRNAENMFCYLGNQSTVTQAVLVLTGWMGAHVRVRNSSFSDVSRTHHTYSICCMFKLKSLFSVGSYGWTQQPVESELQPSSGPALLQFSHTETCLFKRSHCTARRNYTGTEWRHMNKLSVIPVPLIETHWARNSTCGLLLISSAYIAIVWGTVLTLLLLSTLDTGW